MKKIVPISSLKHDSPFARILGFINSIWAVIWIKSTNPHPVEYSLEQLPIGFNLKSQKIYFTNTDLQILAQSAQREITFDDHPEYYIRLTTTNDLIVNLPGIKTVKVYDGATNTWLVTEVVTSDIIDVIVSKNTFPEMEVQAGYWYAGMSIVEDTEEPPIPPDPEEHPWDYPINNTYFICNTSGYFNLNYTPTEKTQVRLVFRTNYPMGGVNQPMFIYGSRDSATASDQHLWYMNLSYSFAHDRTCNVGNIGSGSQKMPVINPNEKIIYFSNCPTKNHQDENRWAVYNIEDSQYVDVPAQSAQGAKPTPFVSARPLYLLTLNNGGTPNAYVCTNYLKFYQCTIWEDGELVKNFVPFADRELRETISGEIITQLGTTTLAYNIDTE